MHAERFAAAGAGAGRPEAEPVAVLVGKVQPGVLAKQDPSGTVIGSRRIFRRQERSNVSGPSVFLDERKPTVVTTRPRDPLVSRLVILLRSAIQRVLLPGGAPQVAASIEHSVAVDMIDFGTRGALGDGLVHEPQFARVGVRHSPVTSQIPAKPRDPVNIFGVDNNMPAARQWHKGRSVILDFNGGGCVPARTRTVTSRRKLMLRNTDYRPATLAGKIKGHGDLQSLCRAPGRTHSGAGVSSAILLDFKPKMEVRGATATR